MLDCLKLANAKALFLCSVSSEQPRMDKCGNAVPAKTETLEGIKSVSVVSARVNFVTSDM